jgi:hypothetical protein
VSLFRRRRAGDKVPAAEDVESDVLDEDADDLTDADEDEDGDSDEDDDVEAAESGPYDVGDAPDDDVERLDLGALKIPALPGVEVQLQANEQGAVASVTLLAGRNAVQVGVFAAPRSEGIWDEVRAELTDSLRAEGGRPTEVTGEYGPELTGRVKTPNGPQDVRFVGIDGPRWFVRAVFQGAVASNPDAAPELARVLRNLVVDRGDEPMPVREPLPLQLPPDALEQQRAAQEAEGPDGRQVPGR